MIMKSLFKVFLERERINHLSSRTPAQRVEGSAVVRTGYKQIPPLASPSFGMTYFSKSQILHRL
jgi:hypothetical protein